MKIKRLDEIFSDSNFKVKIFEYFGDFEGNFIKSIEKVENSVYKNSNLDEIY